MQAFIGFLNHLMMNKQLKSINPKNNLKLRLWNVPSLNEIDSIIEKSAEAQIFWNDINLKSRIIILKKLTFISMSGREK